MGDVAVQAGPVVGREREAAALRAAWSAAVAGQTGAVLLAGDAGVGKTRLLAALVDDVRAEGGTALVGHCLTVGGVGLPYLAFSEALAPLHEAGTPVLGGGAAGESGQLQLFDGVARALSEAAARAPVLLVLEDLHWADESTRDLLAFLLARVRDQRLLVVGSYRAEDLHRRHPLRAVLADLVRLPYVERLDLAPFSLDELGRFLGALDAAPVPDAVVRRIHERSGGNAYFAQELFESGGGGTELPQALADVLLARVESLPAPVRHVAEVASVGGRRVADALLRRVAGLDDGALDAALREAVVASVLVPDGGDSYAFRHALLQEAVYGDLLPGERVRLHAAYAQALDDGLGSAAALAHHRSESHDVPGALVASLAAADEADRLRAPAEAGQHLERALRLWSAVPDAEALTGTDQVHLTLRTAGVASQGGRVHRAIALSRSARELADAEADPALAALAAARLAEHLLAVDEDDAARASALEAVHLAPGSPSAAWGEALAARSLIGYLGREDETRAHAERAREQAAALDLPAVEGDALTTLSHPSLHPGGGAAELLDRAVDRARAAGDLEAELRASFNVVVDHYERGDLVTASRVVDAAVERCTSTGLTWSPYGLQLRHFQVMTRYTLGDFAGSARAARLVSTSPPDAVAARLAAGSLFSAVAAGEPGVSETIRRLESAWHHDSMIALSSGGCGVDLLIWQGEPQAALEALDHLVQHMTDRLQPWFLAGIWLSALGVAAAADLAATARMMRDPDGEARAVAHGTRLLETARRTAREGHPRSGQLGPEGLAWLQRAEAEATRLLAEPGVAAWQAAVEAFGYGHVYEQARSRWRLAEALLAADRRDDAAAELAVAREAAAQLGARPLLAAIDVSARRGRLGRSDVAAPGPLTAREREVLALLAEGRTNRQIGQQLYISEKTASVHVSNLMAKLGASGRTDAVSRAYRAGLLASR